MHVLAGAYGLCCRIGAWVRRLNGGVAIVDRRRRPADPPAAPPRARLGESLPRAALGAATLEDANHAIRNTLHGHMLPRADDGPPAAAQRARYPAISAPVGRELPLPELRVRLRRRSVKGAPMPEAAVDEHGDAQRREDDVGSDPERTHRRRAVDVESQPPTVKLAAERQLRCGVHSPVAAHDGGDPGAACLR